MFGPYAAKATIEHVWDAGTLNVWMTFHFPMNQLIQPADSVWVVDIDGTDYTPDSSSWQDAYTMMLVISGIASFPSVVRVKFDGPDSLLETTWHKNWEPWGYIPSSNIGSFDQSLNTTDEPTFESLDLTTSLEVGGLVPLNSGPFGTGPAIAGFTKNVNGITGILISNTNAGTAADQRIIVLDETGNYTALTLPSTGNTSGALFGLARAVSTFLFNSGGTTRSMGIGTLGAAALVLGTSGLARLTIAANGTITIGGLVNAGGGFAVSGGAGLASQVIALAKLTVGGTAGSFTVTGGIVTAYTAPT